MYQTERRSNFGRRVFDRCPSAPDTGRVPHVSRLMALAIRFDRLIRDGVVAEAEEVVEIASGLAIDANRSQADV